MPRLNYPYHRKLVHADVRYKEEEGDQETKFTAEVILPTGMSSASRLLDFSSLPTELQNLWEEFKNKFNKWLEERDSGIAKRD